MGRLYTLQEINTLHLFKNILVLEFLIFFTSRCA